MTTKSEKKRQYDMRQLVLKKYDDKCAYCAIKLNGKFQVDHLVPQANFKTHIQNGHKVPLIVKHLQDNDVHHFDNLMPACASCNNYKSCMDLETFRKELSLLNSRLFKTISIYKISKRFGLVIENNNPIKFYFEK